MTILGSVMVLVFIMTLMMVGAMSCVLTIGIFSSWFRPHIKWSKSRVAAVIPSKTDGNAGFDIYPIYEKNGLIIKPGEVVILPTGLHYEISKHWHLIAKERGSTGKMALSVRAGVNDNIYRGEVMLLLNNTSDKTICIVDKDKPYDDIISSLIIQAHSIDGSVVLYDAKKACGQLVPVFSPHGTWEEVKLEDLNSTDRGDGKFGSSGK